MSWVVSKVEEAFEDVVDLGKKAVTFVIDKIIDPVVNTVSGVIEAALDDPIKTIAQIAAVATGNSWALPLIEGADVAIAGGDIGDVLEATAKAYVVQQVGSYVGKAAGSFVGEAATEAGAELGTKKIITDAVTSGVRSATVAVATGQDPLKALVTGGVTAGTAATLGQIDGFKEFAKTNPAAASAISSGVGAALSGGNVSNAAIMGLISGANIVKDIIKQVDPDNGTAKAKLDPTQTAIVTDVLMNTASVAINGGQPSSVVKGALLKAGSQALGEMINGTFKSTATNTTTKYTEVVKKSEALEKNISDQEAVADDYNNLKSQIDIRITEQSRLAGLANAAINTYNNDKTQANYDAAIAAKNTADAYTTALNKDYAEFYRPNLDAYSTKLKGLQSDHDELTTGYTNSMSGFKNAIDNLTAALDPIYFTSNRAFVEAMNPEFKADEYRKINGLGADVDVYAHFLEEGQFKGLPTNNEAAKGLVNNTATSTAVDKSSPTAVPKDEVFDGTNYASVAAAQKNAAAMGRTYFMGPDGNTYKILSDAETKDKIKGAATFGEAFSMARKTLGPGAKFDWTNPETGKTTSFTTQTKEEAAAAANAGSMVKVTDDVTQYVSNRILNNIKDYDNINPADLTKAEYQGFINSYLNATDAQRQQMLKGADSMTYNVIATVLKEAPDAIKAKGTATSIIPSSGEIKASDYTNYSQIVKAGLTAVATDIGGVVARGAEWAGKALGLDTAAVNNMQQLFAEKRDTEMSKLVGMERPVAAGIASFIESFGTFYVGGPVALMLTTGSITANNSWVEGGSAVIDSRGNSFSSAEEARKNGVFEYRKLTDAENAIRTAAMTSFEMAFEKLGIPGMNKLMQGVPLNGGTEAFVAAVKRNAAGMGIEQGTEIATTIAQLTFDKMASFGLAQNATLADYTKAIGDTVIATAVAVGGTTSSATMLNNLRNASTALRDESSVSVTPLKYDTVVARDSKGNNVTLAELVTATSVADFSNPTANADLADLTPLVDLRSTVNLGDMNVKLSDILGGAQTAVRSTDVLSESAVAEIFRASNFVPDENTVKGFVGQLADTLTFTNINKFVDQNKLDAKEVVEIAKKEGIQLTEYQAQTYVQQGDEAALSAKLAATLDPTSTTFDEAKKFFTDRGFVPTDAEVQQFTTKLGLPTRADVDAARARFGVKRGSAKYDPKYDWNGDGTISAVDALNLLKAASGRSDVPVPATETGWTTPGPRAEEDASKAISEYINPIQVTFDEAKKYLTERGYNPTDAEVRTFVGQVNEAEQATKIAEYADKNMVSAQEVRDAYAALGLKQPTDADVQKLVGQYSQADLAAKAEANLEPARYNSVLAQIESLSQKDNLTQQDVTDAITKYMTDNPGLNATDVTNVVNEAVKGLATSKDVKDTITEATKGFATKADIDTAIANIKFPAGISKEDVSAAISKYMTDNPGLNAKDVTAAIAQYMTDNPPLNKADVSAAITEATKGFATKEDIDTAIANIKFPPGISKTDVADTIKTYMEANPGLNIDDVIEVVTNATADLTTTDDVKTAVELALEGYATSKDVAAVQKNVLDKMAEYEAAGIKRDEALDKAITDVAASVGKSKTEILGQIGAPATVDADGNPIAATGVYKALETGLASVQKNVLDKMAEYEAAGIRRDVALDKAVTDVAASVGKSKTEILEQIGTPATTDASGNVVAATGIYKTLETGLAGVQKNVLDKVAEYEAAGLKRDDALAAAVKDVSDALGLTEASILGQIGTPASVDAQGKAVPATGIYAALETSAATVQKTVLDKVAEYEAAGIKRDDALSRAIDDVSLQLGKTKTDIQSQIGTPQTIDQNGNVVPATGVYAAIGTAAQTAQKQITDLQTDLQTKYAGLSQGQKDLTDLLTKQGIDLNTAIQAVQADTAAGFKDVLSQLGTTQADLQRQIADTATAAQERTDALARANAAQTLTTQRRGGFNTLLNMLSQAQDLGGQQVTVKQADPAKIGYIYDWSSIFANPQQQKMFASPYGAYAQGGVVRDEMDDVNDELLKLLRG
jgi:hypothetical protein